jgi:hypothetical protein
MNTKLQTIGLLLLVGFAPAACQDTGNGATGGKEAAAPGQESATAEADPGQPTGKPSAPITMAYSIVGNAIVGQPVSINLEVKSSLPDTPVTLHYRINDARTLTFPQAQAQRVTLGTFGEEDRRLQQVTVVPRRDGRLYLNVSAEIETDDGMLQKSMAIPIQVGQAPRQLESNGEPRERADGETVISLPAEESTL